MKLLYEASFIFILSAVKILHFTDRKQMIYETTFDVSLFFSSDLLSVRSNPHCRSMTLDIIFALYAVATRQDKSILPVFITSNASRYTYDAAQCPSAWQCRGVAMLYRGSEGEASMYLNYNLALYLVVFLSSHCVSKYK